MNANKAYQDFLHVFCPFNKVAVPDGEIKGVSSEDDR